ncbi:MAG: hypothetical protein M1825_005268 [Sarcosagium campestre]|nr:MAG: hypothetical protein M1825_005268 [Sarcosagium campestre]
MAESSKAGGKSVLTTEAMRTAAEEDSSAPQAKKYSTFAGHVGVPSSFNTPRGHLSLPQSAKAPKLTSTVIKAARLGQLTGALEKGKIYCGLEFEGIVDPLTAALRLVDGFDLHTKHLSGADEDLLYESNKTIENLFFVSLRGDELPTYHFWVGPNEPIPVLRQVHEIKSPAPAVEIEEFSGLDWPSSDASSDVSSELEVSADAPVWQPGGRYYHDWNPKRSHHPNPKLSPMPPEPAGHFAGMPCRMANQGIVLGARELGPQPGDSVWEDREALFEQAIRKDGVDSVIDSLGETKSRLFRMIVDVPSPPTFAPLQGRSDAGQKHEAVQRAFTPTVAFKMTQQDFGQYTPPLTGAEPLVRGGTVTMAGRHRSLPHTEQPLEFLKPYNQRSHGRPILRRQASAPSAETTSVSRLEPYLGTSVEGNKGPDRTMNSFDDFMKTLAQQDPTPIPRYKAALLKPSSFKALGEPNQRGAAPYEPGTRGGSQSHLTANNTLGDVVREMTASETSNGIARDARLSPAQGKKARGKHEDVFNLTRLPKEKTITRSVHNDSDFGYYEQAIFELMGVKDGDEETVLVWLGEENYRKDEGFSIPTNRGWTRSWPEVNPSDLKGITVYLARQFKTVTLQNADEPERQSEWKDPPSPEGFLLAAKIVLERKNTRREVPTNSKGFRDAEGFEISFPNSDTVINVKRNASKETLYYDVVNRLERETVLLRATYGNTAAIEARKRAKLLQDQLAAENAPHDAPEPVDDNLDNDYDLEDADSYSDSDTRIPDQESEPDDSEFNLSNRMPPLAGGPDFPSITPRVQTISESQEQQRQLRQVYDELLDKEVYCRICERSFKPADHGKIENHYEQHRKKEKDFKQLCPICKEHEWTNLDDDSKKRHLEQDHALAPAKGSAVCPVTDCGEILLGNDGLSLRETLDHLVVHADRNRPRQLCLDPGCQADLTGISNEGLKKHSLSHEDGTIPYGTALPPRGWKQPTQRVTPRPVEIEEVDEEEEGAIGPTPLESESEVESPLEDSEDELGGDPGNEDQSVDDMDDHLEFDEAFDRHGDEESAPAASPPKAATRKPKQDAARLTTPKAVSKAKPAVKPKGPRDPGRVSKAAPKITSTAPPVATPKPRSRLPQLHCPECWKVVHRLSPAAKAKHAQGCEIATADFVAIDNDEGKQHKAAHEAHLAEQKITETQDIVEDDGVITGSAGSPASGQVSNTASKRGSPATSTAAKKAAETRRLAAEMRAKFQADADARRSAAAKNAASSQEADAENTKAPGPLRKRPVPRQIPDPDKPEPPGPLRKRPVPRQIPDPAKPEPPGPLRKKPVPRQVPDPDAPKVPGPLRKRSAAAMTGNNQAEGAADKTTADNTPTETAADDEDDENPRPRRKQARKSF